MSLFLINFYFQSAIKEMVRICNLPSPTPLSFIIVSKRINTRFFLKGSSAAANSTYANPRCGTVCDNAVTHSYRYDFFLVSQNTTQGTALPVYFNVIHNDDAGVSPNNQQKLAYALTHLYYNWPVCIVHILLFFIYSQLTQSKKDNFHVYYVGHSSSTSTASIRSQIGVSCRGNKYGSTGSKVGQISILSLIVCLLSNLQSEKNSIPFQTMHLFLI